MRNLVSGAEFVVMVVVIAWAMWVWGGFLNYWLL
jgi:hypothetical protein